MNIQGVQTLRETLRKESLMNRVTLFGLIAVIFGAFGCAEPNDDINYVQPYYVEKSLFQGEWLYKQTIVDVSPELSIGFVGLEGAMEKVSWEIKKDLLVAYRTHEAIVGLDEDTTQDGSDYRGDPVAMFAITSHFDIKRSYNANTGELSNTIAENTSDRPWYEREFIRVAWTSNLMEGRVDLSFMAWNSQSTDYIRETEIYDPDQIQLNDDYIQVTQQVVLSDGGMTCYYSYGNFNCGSGEGRVRMSFAKIDPNEQYEPRSYEDLIELKEDNGRKLKQLYVGVPLNNPTEGKYFHCSQELLDFLNGSRDARQDYTMQDCDPVNYDQFGRFGFFRSERYSFDRRVGGGHDDHREFHAAIHNVWANPYLTGADGLPTVDGNGKKQQTPLADRRVKPVVYYLNVNFPEDLAHVAGKMANDWDGPFFSAVRAATGKDETTIRDQVASEFGGPEWSYLPGDELGARGVFQIRRNACSTVGIEGYLRRVPNGAAGDKLLTALEGVLGETSGARDSRVTAMAGALKRGNLPKVCAALTNLSRGLGLEDKFTWQQVGDVRFNMLNWINEPQPSGPLGYGPSAVDKETGQIHSGTANMYGASVDTYARSAADIVRAMNEVTNNCRRE
jgi:hypothetical protein